MWHPGTQAKHVHRYVRNWNCSSPAKMAWWHTWPSRISRGSRTARLPRKIVPHSVALNVVRCLCLFTCSNRNSSAKEKRSSSIYSSNPQSAGIEVGGPNSSAFLYLTEKCDIHLLTKIQLKWRSSGIPNWLDDVSQYYTENYITLGQDSPVANMNTSPERWTNGSIKTDPVRFFGYAYASCRLGGNNGTQRECSRLYVCNFVCSKREANVLRVFLRIRILSTHWRVSALQTKHVKLFQRRFNPPTCH